MSTSSSTTVSATTVNGVTRFSGLSSGIDVDSLVAGLVAADSGTLNQLNQQTQIDQWKQTQYQAITADIQAFSTKYLSLTSSDSIMMQSNFQQFSVSNTGTDATATATANAVAGTHTLSVSQLATAATQSSTAGITKDVEGSSAPTYSSLQGTSFNITVDGTARTVSFDSAYTGTTSADGVAYVQAAINTAIGTTTDSSGTTINKITVSTDTDSSGALIFAPTADSGVGSITVSDGSSSGSFSAMGFTSSSVLTNRLSTSDTLATIVGELKSTGASSIINADSGDVDLTINGKSFSFDKTDTLSSMMSTINKDTTANVTMSYNQNTDQLVITANNTGAGNTLSISDTTGTFVSALLSQSTAGQDAKIVLDGQSLTRSSNTILQDGVSYTLNNVTAATATAATIGISQDTDGIYTTISNFITGYNTLIDTINEKLSETPSTSYPPLTAVQESSMTDTEISNWNVKAETGLLHNDSTLQNMLDNIRSTLLSSAAGQTENLTSMGITTTSYTEKGDLHIDEDTLKAAIQNDPQGVMNLFTQQSTTYPGTTIQTLTSSQRAVRTSQEGLAYQFYDIVQDNIGTATNSSGDEGLLLQIAGTPNDTSATTNNITKDIASLADKITAEQTRLNDEEDRYYTEFTNMETALSNISSQSSILASMGTSSS